MINKIKVNKFLDKIRVAKRGTEISPHKYILLLSIADIFDINNDHKNYYTYEKLEPLFNKNFELYFGDFPDYRKTMEHPFYYLQNDGFWHLKPKIGKEQLYRFYQQKRLTRKRLLETIEYAYLDEFVFSLLTHLETRETFKHEIKCLLGNLLLKKEETLNDNSGSMAMRETASLYKHEQESINFISANIQGSNIGTLISNILIYDNQSNN